MLFYLWISTKGGVMKKMIMILLSSLIYIAAIAAIVSFYNWLDQRS